MKTTNSTNGKAWRNHSCLLIGLKTFGQCSPLGTAVFEGHYLTAKAFLLMAEEYSCYTGFDINNYFELDGIGYSLLHLAVAGMVYCNLNLLRSQLFAHAINCNSNSNKNKQDKINCNTTCQYEHLKIIHLLFDHGIDVNIQDNLGITAFHILLMDMPDYQLCFSFLPFVKQASINLDTQTVFGTTVLHDCVSSQRARVLSAKLLLEYGANMFIPDNDGVVAVDMIDITSGMEEQLFANAITIRNNNYDRMLTHNTSNMCDICGNVSKVDVDRNFVCDGCNSRTYCSLKCQRYDWIQNNHQKQCLHKQNELKQTKILETSGQNKLDLCFNVQSDISEKETFYGEDFPWVLRQNVDFQQVDNREDVMALYHRLNQLKENQSMTNIIFNNLNGIKLEGIHKQYRWLRQLHSKYGDITLKSITS